MREEDSAASYAIAALPGDTAAAWQGFVSLASRPVWAASLRAAPRRPQAEALFSHLMARLHEERLSLAPRWAASGLRDAMAFLVREIDLHVGHWLVGLFRAEAPEAADALVRVFQADVKAWLRRAAPAGCLAGLEDREQDVYAALLADKGRRITAYQGAAPFRAFLRTVVVNLAAESARREHGRIRPGASAKAAAGRPRLVSLNDDDHPLDPADDRDDPEAALLALEAMLTRTAREEAVLAALRQLPPDIRRVLEARFLDGLKPREIAERSGREVKEIYRILERTLAHLKLVLV